MITDFEPRLRAFAEVVVRVGLNLQPGQRLLIAEPYELQGVARSAEVIVDAVRRAAACEVEVIWGDGARLRAYAANKDWRGYAQLVGANARRMQHSIDNHDALLFLQGSQPQLLAGLAAHDVAELRRIGWAHFGPVAQQLMQGATNWTVAPAPAPAWAQAVYTGLPSEQRLAALWKSVFEAMRIPVTGGALGPDPSRDKPAPTNDPIAAWQSHLAALQRRCAVLNAQKHRPLRYQGPGTDLSVVLPAGHVWCTAQMTAKSGVPFVANLPTEEIFTAPHRNSTEGTVRVSRPVNYGGSVIDGIELGFRRGRVVSASARTGADLLARLLDTDEGAARLGEVAVVPERTSLGRTGRLFYHPLLDENAQSHVALGEACRFCQNPPEAGALNRSLVHVDLPIEADLILPGAEPA
ncbi:MAG: aminopeptidase [Opitutae bacterium]|nr:aminopeptidase [Opitutae bacterium]